jgi:hypothetical protein
MRNAILAAALLLAPLATWAADDYKPLDVKVGLWEATTSSQTSGAPPIPEELLSKLTPEQRAKMDAAVKARQAQGPQTRVTKSCLTKDALAKAMAFGGGGDNDTCKRTLVSSSSSKQEVHIECNDENTKMKSSGDLHLEAVNSETVKGSLQIASTNGTNKMNVQTNFSAKWLSANCGDAGKK